MNHQFNFEIERFEFEPELEGGWQGEVNRSSRLWDPGEPELGGSGQNAPDQRGQ